MWKFQKWDCGKCVYTSPALSRGDGESPAVAHSDKCNLLRNTLFPTQPTITDEPTIDLEPRANDMEYHEVTKQEACDALFTAAPMNAPGITGMTRHTDGPGQSSRRNSTTSYDYVPGWDTTPKNGIPP